MTVIGITGGIGSGKSVVSRLLEIYGVPVYDADRESKRLTVSSPVIRERLTALLGADIYTPEGLNRALMAERIFCDAVLLEQVNAIIHPEVSKDFDLVDKVPDVLLVKHQIHHECRVAHYLVSPRTGCGREMKRDLFLSGRVPNYLGAGC